MVISNSVDYVTWEESKWEIIESSMFLDMVVI